MLFGYILIISFYSSDQIFLKYETEQQCRNSIEANIDKYKMSNIKNIDCFELYSINE